MDELTTHLLILLIIIQSITLFIVIRREFKKPPISIGLANSMGGKITRDSCEKLGGSVVGGRCIIRVHQDDKVIIEDIGEII